jgi:hypothetical protein
MVMEIAASAPRTLDDVETSSLTVPRHRKLLRHEHGEEDQHEIGTERPAGLLQDGGEGFLGPQVKCDRDQYRSQWILVGCQKESGTTLRLDQEEITSTDGMKPGNALVIVPANTESFEVTATKGRLTMHPVNDPTTDAFAGKKSFQEGDMKAAHSSTATDSSITLTGRTTEPFQIQVFLPDKTSAKPAVGEKIAITYNYGSHTPCGSRITGCKPCSEFAKCTSPAIAKCDGSWPKCEKKLATAADARMPTQKTGPNGEPVPAPLGHAWPSQSKKVEAAKKDPSNKEIEAAKLKAAAKETKDVKAAHDKEMAAANKRLATANTDAKEYVKAADDHMKYEIKKRADGEKQWQDEIKSLRKQNSNMEGKFVVDAAASNDALVKEQEAKLTELKDKIAAEEKKLEDERKGHAQLVKQIDDASAKIADLRSDISRSELTHSEKHAKIGLMEKHVTNADDTSLLKLRELETAVEQSEAAGKLKVKELVLSKMRHIQAHSEVSSKKAAAIVKSERASQDSSANAFDKFVKDESTRMQAASAELATMKETTWKREAQEFAVLKHNKEIEAHNARVKDDAWQKQELHAKKPRAMA